MVGSREIESRLVGLEFGDGVWRNGPDSWYIIFYAYTMGDEKYP